MPQTHLSTAPSAHVRALPARRSERSISAVLVRHRRALLLSIIAAVVAVVSAQVAYPANRVLPFTKIAGHSIGLKSQAEVEQVLVTLSQQKIRVRAAQQNYEPTLHELGVEFEADTSARALVEYPLHLRLIPFSSLFYGRQRDAEALVTTTVDETAMRAFAERVAAENTHPASEGAVHIEEGRVKASLPRDGAIYQTDDVVTSLRSLGIRTPDAMVLPSEPIKPAIPAPAIEAAAAKARAILAQPLKLVVADKEHTVEAGTIAGWIAFAPNAETKEVDLQFDVAAMKLEISAFARDVNEAAGATIITTIDSNEISRAPGTAGKYVDADKAVQAMTTGMLRGERRIELALDSLQPGITYQRSYTSTSAGLQALIREWAHDHPYVQLAVSFREIGGQGRRASWNADTQFLAASMYKLHVAHYILHQIQTGALDANAQVGIGYSLTTCLERMIVISENACPIAIADVLGWGAINEFAHSHGFTRTHIAARDNHITAHDTAEFLAKLYHGELLNTEHTNRFMDMLKRQRYRTAIPKGSRGADVADKVGIYGSYWHDGAIVYHPKTTYVLVILTKGGGPANIADLAGKIYDVINQ